MVLHYYNSRQKFFKSDIDLIKLNLGKYAFDELDFYLNIFIRIIMSMKEEIVAPIFGPKKLETYELFGYDIKVQDNTRKINIKKVYSIIRNDLNSRGIIGWVGRNKVITFNQEVKINLYSLDGKDIILEHIKITQESIVFYLRKIINQLLHDYFISQTKGKAGRNYIYPGEKLLVKKVNNINLRLLKHNAIRYSTYINNECTEFLIILYFTNKLTILPRVHELINKSFKCEELFVVGDHPELISGQIQEVIPTDHLRYDLYYERKIKEYKDLGINIQGKPPMIYLSAPRRQTDDYEFSPLYRIQARFDTLDSFNESFGIDLNEIHSKLSMSLDEYEIKIKEYNEILNKLFTKNGLIR